MRLRQDVYDKYKSNPNFEMYDIYHWEAHPTTGDSHTNGQFSEPSTVTHRVLHYEAYLAKYSYITLPGLVDDGSGKNCIVSKLWNASYTTIVVIGLDSIVKFRRDFPSSSWPTTSGGTTKTYSDLDKKITELLPQVGITYNKAVNLSEMKLLYTSLNGDIFLSIPLQLQHTLGIYTMAGRCIVLKEGNREINYNVSDMVPAGSYIIRVTSGDKNSYVAPVVIKK